jgi:hypothetical protein
MPGVGDILEWLADNKGPGLPPELLTLVAAFQGGKRDTYEDFSIGERCILGPNTPMVPGLGDNYMSLVQSKDHVVLLTDATRRTTACRTPFPVRAPTNGEPRRARNSRYFAGSAAQSNVPAAFPSLSSNDPDRPSAAIVAVPRPM